MACTWSLFGAAPISVSFTSFSTEASYDVMRLYDGTSNSSSDGSLKSLSLLAILSGSSAKTLASAVTSSGKSLTIVFSSDDSMQSSGFVATVVSNPIDENSPS